MVTLLSEERLLELLAGVAVLLREGVAHPLDQLPHQVVLQGHPLPAVAVQVRLDQRRQVPEMNKNLLRVGGRQRATKTYPSAIHVA